MFQVKAGVGATSCLIAVVAVLASCPASSHAGAVFGDTSTMDPPLIAAGGTNSFFAFSQQFQPIVTAPNLLVNGVGPPVPSATLIRIGSTRYGPTVTVQKRAKPAQGMEAISSDSATTAKGLLFGASGYDRATNKIMVNAFATPDVRGQAAAAIFDPFQVQTNVSNYQYQLNASLSLDKRGDFGGLMISAVDNRTLGNTDLDTFYSSGQPADKTLWTLTVTTNGNLTSNTDNDLNVQFVMPHPEDFEPLLSPSQIALIGDNVKNAFQFANGTATLSNYSLFPDSLTYLVGGGVTYAVGENAGLSSVPEPSTSILLGLGLLGVYGYTRRRGKQAA